MIEAVRVRDHVQICVSDEEKVTRFILALPDSSRFSYVSITGEHCFVHNIRVEMAESEIDPLSIPRIAEEVSYIKDQPTGDIPNVQIESWRADASEGIRIEDSLTLSFHSISLPSAHLVWHCPYISLFHSSDAKMKGEGFREYLLLRMDGEDWTSDEHVVNDVQVTQQADFVGWDAWKEKNKEGIDCIVTIRKEKGRVLMETENLGIAIRSTTTILDGMKEIYVSITGDQCAVTNIHVKRP